VPSIRTLHRSFAGGEISPEMFGRNDDAKYLSGLARCRNFVVKPQGPAESRAGFAFVRAVQTHASKVRLIAFTYSTTQTMVIEMGAGYFRFHTQGATLMNGAVPYEIANPYAQADLFDIHYVQSADVLTLTHPNHAPRELRRMGALDWQLSVINFAATLTVFNAPSLTTAGVTAAKYNYQYVITVLAADGLSESAASQPAEGVSMALAGVTNANPGVFTTAAAHGLLLNDPVKVVVFGMPAISLQLRFLVDSVPAPDKVTLRTPAGAAVDTSAYGTFMSGGITPEFIRSNLFETGATVTISWAAVVGAARYNVYKLQGGLYGYIGQTTGLSLVDDNIAPDLGKTPPIYDDVFNAAGEYPGAVSYFEQRRWFAGSLNKPQNILATKAGTESTMSYALPLRDDDRISFRVAAREANTIRHIVPLSELLLLTSAAEWRVTSVNSDAITPSSISVRPQSYVGASNAQSVIINNTLIYAAARGGHVREMAYNWQASGFLTGDLSLRAAHLFDGFEIADMAYAKAPQPVVWFVSTSGKLLSLTYVPEQQIGAWAWHDTDGTFESCTVVAEGAEDVLYCIVRRTVNGASVRYVERMASRQFVDPADAFFVDSGLTYAGAPVATISGLGHLEGKQVAILADGAVHPRRTVSAGSITLDVTASKVQAGLPIEADLQTLPVAAALQDGSAAQGRFKNVNKAWLRVQRSSGICVGPTLSELVEYKQRTDEAYGAPPRLTSEEIEITLHPAWAESGQIYIRQNDPLPLTVVSLTAEVALGG
jgi:hypothetical protein